MGATQRNELAIEQRLSKCSPRTTSCPRTSTWWSTNKRLFFNF